MVEEIPSEDLVSRHIDSPDKWHPDEKRFIDDRVFLFRRPDEVESVVWRKYAQSIQDVHAKGCERQAAKRSAGNTIWTYEGATTANVGAIRAITSTDGDRIEVVHEPSEGVHHAHLEYRLIETQERIKQRKTDLKEHLRNTFSDLDAHRCAE
jgi:hypothetical protein